MTDEWKPQVVVAGDHLRKLAFRAGVDAEEVWAHPTNAELAAKRENPDMLSAGDVIHLPVKPPQSLPVRAQTGNKYRAFVPMIAVRLNLASERCDLAGERFEVHGVRSDKAEPVGTVGQGGEVAFEVPTDIRAIELHLPRVGMVMPIRVGDLDPPDERSGVVQRLRTLGYLREGPASDEDIAYAVRLFQHAYGMTASGRLDSDTRRALKSAHGQ